LGREVVEGELIAALKRSPVFSALKPDEFSSIAGIAKIKDFDANQFIVNEGDPPNAFYLILSGLVELRRASRPLGRLGRGQFFGETTLVGDLTPSGDILAVRKTRCMVLSGSELRSYPTVAAKLLRQSAPREQEAALQPAPQAASAPPLAIDDTIEFKSNEARLLFDHLVKAFTEDYMVRRLYFEQAGWMSLSALAKATGVPRATLYGENGNFGSMMNELLARGLVETRTFTGERGRGGEVLRVRIAYDKEPVKWYVDRDVLRGKSDRRQQH
jgi:CRP-like cAMP-binding protein